MHEAVLDDRQQVSLGSLDDPERVRADDHVRTLRQLSWVPVDDALPRFERTSATVPSRALHGDG